MGVNPMVAPITGPTRELKDYAAYFERRERYKQVPPYSLCLPYTAVFGQKVSGTGNLAAPNHRPMSKIEYLRTAVLDSTQHNQAKINAYEKFKAAIGDRSQMGENLAQIGKSFSTIERRAIQLWNFTRAIKKGHLKTAFQILQTPQPKRLHPVKEQGNNWLEYHLGIEPAVKDIFTAVDIIQQPIKAMKVKARGHVGTFSLGGYTTTAPWSLNFSQGCTWLGVEYGAEIAISNPNLYLANSMGIINPVQVLWQLVPLSFVLDWFVNVESFLGSYTDFYGLTVQKSYTTVKYGVQYDEWWTTYGWQMRHVGTGMDRSPGISLPGLGLRPYKQLSWQRGLTAISLLVPALKSLSLVGYDAAARDKAAYRRRVNDSINIYYKKK